MTLNEIFSLIRAGDKAPESVKIDLFVMMSDGGWISFHDRELDDYKTLLSQKVVLNLSGITRESLVETEIGSLRERQKRIRGEAQAKVANIEESIQRLLSIEYKPATEES